MKKKIIKISRDFSDTPGGRSILEGDYSGELFRDNLLSPLLKESDKIVIDFDGCYGFGSGFLEEAFGGLVRKHKTKGLLDRLELISNEDESIIYQVKKYVLMAENNLE